MPSSSRAIWRSPNAPGSAVRSTIRVGFVPLVDAAPLIAAAAIGFFDGEGLDVRLEPQIGWGNVRDRLMYGELDASHAPIGMAPASVAGLPHYEQPLGVLAGLSAGGNAITVARRLADLGDAPAAWRRHVGRPLRLAYVNAVGSHHFALRALVAGAGLRLEADVQLCVLPPAQMPGLLERGAIDGFCAGEPWNTLAVARHGAAIVRATADWSPGHPEKGLLVTRRWHERHAAGGAGSVAARLARATRRGGDWCAEPRNADAVAALLARPEHLNVDEALVGRSLSIDRWLRPALAARRGPFRSFAADAVEPTLPRLAWVVEQMARCDVLPASADVDRLARDSLLTLPEPDPQPDTPLTPTAAAC